MEEIRLLTQRIDDGFDRMSEQHADIIGQLRQLNGRVTEAHIKIAVQEQKVADNTESLRIVRARTHQINNDLQTQERRLIKRDAAIVLTTAGAIASIMKWGKTWLGL